MHTTTLRNLRSLVQHATRRADAGLAGTDAGTGLEPRHGTAHARLYGCADDLHRTLITTLKGETPCA